MPNATVTATSIGTAQARTSTTDTEGTYRFGLLPPGTYSLKFEASGFTAVEVSSVTIVVTETSVLDQTLQVGVQTQQVEVRSEAEAVQTASSTVGTVVTGNAVADLPLTSRNYTNLLGLAAGANTGVFNAGNMGKGTEDISVNGAGITQNEMQMDGANIVNSQGKGVISDSGAHSGISVVNPDAIQEFKIQSIWTWLR